VSQSAFPLRKDWYTVTEGRDGSRQEAPTEEDPTMRKTFLYTTGVMTLVGISATGCVRHDRYDTARTTTHSLQEQLVSAQSERETATNALAARDRQLTQAEANLHALQSQYDLLATELDLIDAQNNNLLTTVTDIKFGPLPFATQQQLAALAASYPDDMWFNAETGMIRFGSDFTFSSGRATMRKGASDVISRVAAILNSPEASGFEIVVMGHTDNIQPSSSSQRYPTNWELSTARAVSVAKTLSTNGVDPSRFEISGFGEYKPLVPNRTDGTKENRRVEIYLRPTAETVAWETETQTTETVTIDTMEEPMK
jgi:chemotaxis protein MotB